MVHVFFFLCVCLFLSVQTPLCQEVGGCEFKREPLSHCVPVFVPLTVIHRCVLCQLGHRVCGTGVCGVSNCFNSTWSLILGN